MGLFISDIIPSRNASYPYTERALPKYNKVVHAIYHAVQKFSFSQRFKEQKKEKKKQLSVFYPRLEVASVNKAYMKSMIIQLAGQEPSLQNRAGKKEKTPISQSFSFGRVFGCFALVQAQLRPQKAPAATALAGKAEPCCGALCFHHQPKDHPSV